MHIIRNLWIPQSRNVIPSQEMSHVIFQFQNNKKPTDVRCEIECPLFFCLDIDE